MSASTYRLLNLLLLGALFAGSMMVYPTLPQRFPRHFGVSGQPDAWMERSVLSWLLLPIIAAATAALLEVASRASIRNPSLWNVPDKQRFLALTPAEQAPVIRRLRDFMGMTGLATTALMMLVQASIYDAATRSTPSMPGYVLPAAGLFAVILVILGLRMNSRIAALIQDAYRRRGAA